MGDRCVAEDDLETREQRREASPVAELGRLVPAVLRGDPLNLQAALRALRPISDLQPAARRHARLARDGLVVELGLRVAGVGPSAVAGQEEADESGPTACRAFGVPALAVGEPQLVHDITDSVDAFSTGPTLATTADAGERDGAVPPERHGTVRLSGG
ncbi:hypothetical protein [Actinomadura sp. DC4]|uniref:hypothetical protein n=1 Tax=Actinomadura sp. DC4 TaxID=3055069 RepID=UPI0025AFA52A|nr:hypothetical protein [Actinomadura sp. DC4]MDN3357737.1 hypothetical protein [Actinomadura sp. DC4]